MAKICLNAVPAGISESSVTYLSVIVTIPPLQLATAASEISLLDVINAVDPIPRIKTCPLNLPAHCKKLCPLHSKLDASYAEMEATYRDSFVSEMVEKPKRKR